MKVFLGVDVGTGSARAGFFDEKGTLLGHAVRDIQCWRPEEDHVEQSSEDIWKKVCEAVKEAREAAGVSAEDVEGIGFDATCSLVILDRDGKPVSVSARGHERRDEQNIIVWMDHRAQAEADWINAGNHRVLRNVGGRISPEMEIPKILWLKKHLPDCWKRAEHFFDLPDFLTWRATGELTRSQCSAVCKMTYQAGENDAGWDEGFLKDIGLEDLTGAGLRKLGQEVLAVGRKAGELTEASARELVLKPGTPVAVSLIDAHAGGVGMLGASLSIDENTTVPLEKRLALIGGTSSCHMVVCREARFIPGVWGPYYEAMVPGYWLTEGGQSASGALIDHILVSHAASQEAQNRADAQRVSLYTFLNQHLDRMRGSGSRTELTRDLHVYPDFHGNRSPRADASLRGMISGLSLDQSLDSLALLYLATIQAVAYGTRHILEALHKGGYATEQIIACGGGIKNPVFIQEHADITGCILVIPQEPEAVLLGSAMCGAVAGRAFDRLPDAMSAMSSAGMIYEPKNETYEYHQRKYQVFHQMHEDHMRYRELMQF